ncbi:hypothetical protein ARSQ2_01872 [Arsenophonus endosymbiont of Bemisia tabaci Q2]|nr:hypothetical protein ARSQ2_01872 [Arsenophonus endosymbiont of Bemisia tabaci Q2]
MRETTDSISGTPIVFLYRFFGIKCVLAPASSITLITLSAKWRSVIYFTDKSTAALIALGL